MLRGKHAEIDKVSGKLNVSDCLTKHLNETDTKGHLDDTGFRKFDTPFVLVKLERINVITDLQSAEQLVRDNEERKRALEIVDGLALAKLHLSEDTQW